MKPEDVLASAPVEGLRLPAGFEIGSIAELAVSSDQPLSEMISSLEATMDAPGIKTLQSEYARYSKPSAEPLFRTLDTAPIRSMIEEGRRKRAEEQETLELLRRSTAASEQAIADAQRREREAQAGERRAQRWATLGAIGTIAGLLLAAWPIVMARLEG